jgi:hypothetical protein
VKPRRPLVERVDPAPMPDELIEYRSADWLAPGAPGGPPADGHDIAAWSAYEDAHRAAWARWNAARERWHAENECSGIEVCAATPDEPFNPAVDL